MPEKRYLFTPGPTPVPPEVLAVMAEPVVHHRGPDFKVTYELCLARLQEVFRTEHDVLLFTASGTGAFESAVANLVDPGERHLVVSAGNFGERWADLVGAYGADLVHLRLPWGESPSPDALAAELAQSGPVDAVSSLGAVPLETDAWGIDVVVSGSQKALMAPPGLGMVSVSPAALAARG